MISDIYHKILFIKIYILNFQNLDILYLQLNQKIQIKYMIVMIQIIQKLILY
ncbi:hypothetical protein GLOIN_2v1587115 [Rhizophagus irregularis DAOM 181602=DAOM 197198]|uniref:Uncharacterized protein n=1 Tax=Rhizophagus irregularis (strain DAOM 181602 / DAOM 197198 / MUCL 43194) TaxID=747089 RepID=A0A2P4Q6T2_RHIID|nr:hypothetical protein GLOIN_2v1587115 [Rhizophagus irregularis DAOM 181602=DAOM 197198]POG73349.1 hypothetical protein GLOIN_2v1587115 [Rhizophagus irregularis DAOM 181602=DAOM 197198]|eukprot:XP_025180215.1 hypothetical protein GLOIN_2v1587115 [Rhizophagus irregularis DAOM 181602=DAOM 197198]